MNKSVLLLALSLAAPAGAVETSVVLEPMHTAVAMRAYAMGVVPLDGAFTRFSGTLRLDPAHPAACRVDLLVSVDGLRMSDPDRRAQVLAADMLDAAHFPTLSFQGACEADSLTGRLTMHGVTAPLVLDVERTPGRLMAAGRLRRGEWGIEGRGMTVGSTIRITVSAPIPP